MRIERLVINILYFIKTIRKKLKKISNWSNKIVNFVRKMEC